jgi:hypothetical protein
MKKFKTYNVAIAEQLKDICDDQTRSAVFKTVYVTNMWSMSFIIQENIQKAIYEQTTRN